MSDKVEERLGKRLDAAERAGSCLVPCDDAERKALRYRGMQMVEPVRGMYVRRRTWKRLVPPARARFIMRALARQHPSWCFCNASAAVAFGLPVTWGLLGNVWVSSPPHASDGSPGVVHRHLGAVECERVGGLPVTSLWRTVFDCLVSFELPDALAVADAALRGAGATAGQLARHFRQEYRGRRGVRRALRAARLADPRSESGGESVARGMMCELGFERPELQVWVEDLIEPVAWFRIDFVWLSQSGGLVFGELDGRQKTEQDQYLKGRSAVRALQDERRRESHLTAYRPQVMRFSYDEAIDRASFARMLEAYGVPRDERGRRWEPLPYATRIAWLMRLDGVDVLASECVPD